MLADSVDVRAAGAKPVAKSRGSRFLRHLLIGLDAVALTVAWTIAVLTSTSGFTFAGLATVAACVAGSVVLFNGIGLYRSRVCTVRVLEFERLARACIGVVLLALAAGAVVGSPLSPGAIALGGLLAFLLVTFTRGGYRVWLTNRRRVGHFLRPVLLVGAGGESAEIATLLIDHPELGYRTVGIVGNRSEAARHRLEDRWCADLDDAPLAVAETGVTGVILCASDLRASELNRAVQELLNAGAHVQLSSGLHGIDVGRLRPAPLADEPLFYVERVTLASWQLVTKRAIDLVLASLMLVLTAPVLALAALGVKLGDRGPMFFKQTRVGRDGATFVLYKVRTMREGAEQETAQLYALNAREGPLTKIPQDPRVTMLGRVLRGATSIDELPQLWNVLNGTMSLVGPRPALPDEVAHFDAELRARESVLPGLTGLWQVEGRDNPSFAAYRRFDLFYLQNWSVTLDMMILLGTVEAMITRVFRSLLHFDTEISLAPPEAADPGLEASRAMRDAMRDAATNATSGNPTAPQPPLRQPTTLEVHG